MAIKVSAETVSRLAEKIEESYGLVRQGQRPTWIPVRSVNALTERQNRFEEVVRNRWKGSLRGDGSQ